MPALATPADRLFSCAVRVAGAAADSLLQCVQSISVNEDLDQGSSAQIELQACRNDDGSWPYLQDPNLKPWKRITLMLLFAQSTETVFDGYISHIGCRTHEDSNDITVSISAVDASYHMNLEDKTRIWRAMSYEAIAEEVLKPYGFKRLIAPPPEGDPPAMTAQRGSDHAFLRELARRRGVEFYVLGGNAYFRPPQLDGAPQKLLAVNFGEQTNCTQMSFESDGTAPTEAELGFFDALEGQPVLSTATRSGLTDLGSERLDSLRGAGMPQTRHLARGLGFNSPAQATEYAAGMLRRHGFWVRASGRLNGLKYGAVLRSRRTVTVKGAGPLYNGLYYVRQVQHQIGPRSYEAEFELVRNAQGELGSEDFAGEMPDALGPPAMGAGADPDPIEVLASGEQVLPA